MIAALLTLSAALAATVGVEVQVHGAALPTSSVEASVWHALSAVEGHDAAFLPAAPGPLARAGLSTHLTVDVALPRSLWGDASAHYFGTTPVLTVTERVLHEGTLQVTRTWKVAEPAVFVSTAGGAPQELVEVAFERALLRALAPVQRPAWAAAPPTSVEVPVVIVVERSFRETHGEQWQREAEARLHSAAALLAPAGITLVPVGVEWWEASGHCGDANQALSALASVAPSGPSAPLRLGLLGPDAPLQGELHEVGRAYEPGKLAVVRTVSPAPGQPALFTVATDGVSIAHELLHALGAPHSAASSQLMSSVHEGAVYALGPESVSLARAAAASRWSTWDAGKALSRLGLAADASLTDPVQQVRYVIENLMLGQGVPAPNEVDPASLSSSASLALGVYWLDRADRGDLRAVSWEPSALLHVQRALRERPEAASALRARSPDRIITH